MVKDSKWKIKQDDKTDRERHRMMKTIVVEMREERKNKAKR